MFDHYIVKQHESFEKWLNKLKDNSAKAAIVRRIKRAQSGNLGEIGPIHQTGHKIKLWEIKIDFGGGYRIYFIKNGQDLFLLNGGNKASQDSDINKAISITKQMNQYPPKLTKECR